MSAKKKSSTKRAPRTRRTHRSDPPEPGDADAALQRYRGRTMHAVGRLLPSGQRDACVHRIVPRLLPAWRGQAHERRGAPGEKALTRNLASR